MIGRDVEAQSSRPSRAPARPARRCLEVSGLRWEPTGSSGVDLTVGRGRDRRPRRARRPGPARAAAGAVRRAARRRGRGRDRRPPGVATSARTPPSAAAHRHGARPRGPQDRGPAAADAVADNLPRRRLRPAVARPASSTSAAEARPSTSGSRRLQHQASAAPSDPVGTLSGGNQQKVVIAKWLMIAPRLILLNDPTRGIDVGTKQEIYRLLRELADDGRGDPLLLDRLRRADRLLRPRARSCTTARSCAELEGDAITEDALVASAAQHRRDARREAAALPGMTAHCVARTAASSGACAALRALYLRSTTSCIRAASPPRRSIQNANEGVAARASSPWRRRVPVLTRRPRPLGRRGDDAGQLHRLRARGRLAAQIVLGMRRRRLPPARSSALINGLIVVYGRIQPIITTLATGAITIGLALVLRPEPGGASTRPQLGADQLAARLRRHLRSADGGGAWFQPVANIPVRSSCCRRRVRRLDARSAARSPGRAAYAIGSAEGAAYMSGVPIAPRQVRRLHAGRLLRRVRRALPRDPDLSGKRSTSPRPAPTR